MREIPFVLFSILHVQNCVRRSLVQGVKVTGSALKAGIRKAGDKASNINKSWGKLLCVMYIFFDIE